MINEKNFTELNCYTATVERAGITTHQGKSHQQHPMIILKNLTNVIGRDKGKVVSRWAYVPYKQCFAKVGQLYAGEELKFKAFACQLQREPNWYKIIWSRDVSPVNPHKNIKAVPERRKTLMGMILTVWPQVLAKVPTLKASEYIHSYRKWQATGQQNSLV